MLCVLVFNKRAGIIYVDNACCNQSIHGAIDTGRVKDHQNVFLAVGDAIITHGHLIAKCYNTPC